MLNRNEVFRTGARSALSVALLLTLLFALPAVTWAQTEASDCDDQGVAEAKSHFTELRAQYVSDVDSVDREEFRRAAADYIRAAGACYEARYGSPATDGPRFDEGGMWLGEDGPYADSSVLEKHVLWGTKWGAGTSFTGGTDTTGPRITGGTVTYSFMGDGVDLGVESAGLTNTALTSLGVYDSCFLEEIETAFGAWSAVSDILFVPVTDGGGAFNTEATGDIRIGTHTFDGASGVLAHAFYPPPNGSTAAGDTHFDSAENWTCTPEDGSIDLGIVALHEFGHAIGLGHESTDLAVMNPFYNEALMFGPLADDIIGAGEIYGGAGAAETTFNANVGIGTDAPEEDLHVYGNQNSATKIIIESETGGSAQVAGFDLINDVQAWSIRNGTSGLFTIREVGGDQVLRINPSTNEVFVLGNLVTGGGGTCDPGPCDRTFVDYELESIEEHAAYMWQNKHLWGVGPTPEGAPINLSKKTTGMLHELEKAHIYIEELNDSVKDLNSTIEMLQARLAALEASQSQ